MNGTRILIIDDELSVRAFLRVSLEAHGYKVEEAINAAEGLTSAIQFRPEAILLDLGLPDRSGHEVLKELRTWSQVPVIVLTARDADEDKVLALDGGADDYLTKPFSLQELLARLRVALRHFRSKASGEVLSLGGLEVDFDSHVVRVKGVEVRLTTTEFDILKVLVLQPGKVVTHRNLLKSVWGPNSVEHTQYLRVYIGHLRKKLEIADAQFSIETEAGVGYRFRVEVPEAN